MTVHQLNQTHHCEEYKWYNQSETAGLIRGEGSRVNVRNKNDTISQKQQLWLEERGQGTTPLGEPGSIRGREVYRYRSREVVLGGGNSTLYQPLSTFVNPCQPAKKLKVVISTILHLDLTINLIYSLKHARECTVWWLKFTQKDFAEKKGFNKMQTTRQLCAHSMKCVSIEVKVAGKEFQY